MPHIPSPEHGSNPSGISFDIQEPEQIYQVIAQGGKGKIAQTLLEAPLRGVIIELESDTSTFDLETIVDFGMSGRVVGEDGIDPDSVKRAVASRLAENGKILERGGRLVAQGRNGTRLVIDGIRSGFSDLLMVTTGKIIEPGRIPGQFGERVQVVPSPDVSEESFNKALQDTTDIITLITDVTYEMAGKTPPDETIVIALPKRKMPDGQASNVAEGLVGKIEVERPNVDFEEIGGQEEAKREIEGLAFALSNPQLYRKWGTKPPKGMLLYGPPGTGKTLMAKALASQANAHFFHVQASDIGSKWYGESEQLIQQIFDAASKNGKTIIYFDEVDSIVPNRDAAHEATQRVISVLLQNIDGLGASDNVMLVASTNRMQSIDPAMMRPGRLDRLIEVGLPDEAGREHILAIHLDKANAVAGRKLFDELDTEKVASEAKDFSGADIAEIVRRTLEEKVRQEGQGQEPSLVTTKDLLRELQNYERVRKSKPNEQRNTGQYL